MVNPKVGAVIVLFWLIKLMYKPIEWIERIAR